MFKEEEEQTKTGLFSDSNNNTKSNNDDLKIQLKEFYDTPQELEEVEPRDSCINNSFEKEVKIKTNNKELKELNTNKLILNSYWIELVSKISFSTSLIIYEMIGVLTYLTISGILEKGDFKNLIVLFEFFFQDIGLKWLFIIKLGQHLSIGFFCLTNFSKIFKESKDFFNFFFLTLTKVLIFYLISITIMKQMIEIYFFGTIIEDIERADIDEDSRKNALRVFNNLKIISIRIVGNFLGNYNNNLDKLLIGSLYYFLFSSPKSLKGEKMLLFRLLSIIPIIYIILSLTFRTLNNLGKVSLNLYISPIFVGPKFTIFGFFVTFLFYIKIKEKKYQIFDEEGNIIPSVFAKLSSKIFSIFGFIELFIGLFFSDLSSFGIGNNYLLILCSPIMILYDYKKKYEIHIDPCKKRNLGTCINISVSIFFYSIIIILGIIIFDGIDKMMNNFIKPIILFIKENIELILQLIGQIYSNSDKN